MIKRLSLKPSVIGLDVGRIAIKAVQVGLRDSSPRLEGALNLPRTAHGAALTPGEAQQLHRVLERRGMTASRLVLVAPSDALVGCALNLPPAKEADACDRIVEMELTRTQQLPPDSFEFAWWALPPSKAGSKAAQAHAVALPHSAVMPTISTLCELGLNTLRTVPASLAVLATAQRKPIDARRVSAVLDLGSHRSHLTLMHAGKVVHERTLPDFDIEAIRQQLSESLHIQAPPAREALGLYGLRDEPEGSVACETTAVLDDAMGPLTEEIGLSFAYVSHMYPEAELGPLLLVGGGANMPGLVARIGNMLELETMTITPDDVLAGDCFGSDSADPALAAALGAAFQGGASA